MQSNTSALPFLATAVATFIGELVDPIHMETDGGCWNVLSFEFM
jgi:hypothetical protein